MTIQPLLKINNEAGISRQNASPKTGIFTEKLNMPGGERIRPAGWWLRERPQRAHDIGHGH
jgi:hypothetical protein